MAKCIEGIKDGIMTNACHAYDFDSQPEDTCRNWLVEAKGDGTDGDEN